MNTVVLQSGPRGINSTTLYRLKDGILQPVLYSIFIVAYYYTTVVFEYY
eukprot:COSAG02_NODE_3224_length_7149_cov_5.990071_6_plen_49_part_00